MAEELGHVDDHRVVPILLMVFDRGESSPELRRAAVTALSHARRHLPLRELLAQARESTHSHVRMRALKLLETIGGESVIETMMAVLEDPELPVRATAAMVLARLGHRGAVSNHGSRSRKSTNRGPPGASPRDFAHGYTDV
jgi:HEAT repeat protein